VNISIPNFQETCLRNAAGMTIMSGMVSFKWQWNTKTTERAT